MTRLGNTGKLEGARVEWSCGSGDARDEDEAAVAALGLDLGLGEVGGWRATGRGRWAMARLGVELRVFGGGAM